MAVPIPSVFLLTHLSRSERHLPSLVAFPGTKVLELIPLRGILTHRLRVVKVL